MIEAMTPDEFDRACRRLERACPWLSQTSGLRSAARNASVGGHPKSKHILGMARDYVADAEGMTTAAAIATGLGLHVVFNDTDHADHVHVQGLPVGDPPEWWLEKYWRREEWIGN